MIKQGVALLAFGAALGLPFGAPGAPEETQHPPAQRDQRIEALEQRLRDVEAAAMRAASRPASESALNPAVSLVLNGVYANLSQDPAGFRIDGFVPTMGEVAPPARGLSLGESELVFAANIDPLLRGTLIAALAPEGGAEIEEGYIQTLALAQGFTLKAGRFLSSVGYQNQIHPHAWDFADAPLANKVFLGGQSSDDGIQLKWVAPSETYVDLGAEVGRGRKFPGGPDGGRDKNGFGSGVLFAHLGDDIGASTAWQLGLSYLNTSPQERAYTDLDSTGTSVTNSLSGRSRLWVLDGILKWAPNGNPSETSFKLQGEYFRRKEEGDLTYDTLAESLGPQTGRFASRQSGWYLQGVVQVAPRWRIGLRYDRLSAGTTALGALSAANLPILEAYDPRRESVMLDWSPSEFGRVRVQLARDASRSDATDRQLLIQYIVSLGAHGAHRF